MDSMQNRENSADASRQAELRTEPIERAIQAEQRSDDVDEVDSALGDEISVYTASLQESAYAFPERYGRTYHAYKEGRYTLPNDETEMDRLDVHHHLILLAMRQNLCFAPIPANFNGRALDLATGTGIWAIDFASQYPDATVVGNDLSPTMPTVVPPNCQFYVDDVEAQWTYPEKEKFDLIHTRFLAGAIADWPKLVSQSFAHLNSGGWIECQDWNTWLYSQDNSLPTDSALNKFHMIVSQGRHDQGFNMRPGPNLEIWLRDAGFVDIGLRKVLLPLGPWPKDKMMKEVGIYNMIQMEKAIEGVCLAVLPNLPEAAGGPWTYEEIQVFMAEIRKDMRNPKIHGLYDFWVVWGRKP